MDEKQIARERENEFCENEFFVDSMNTIGDRVYETAKSKGWYDAPREDGTVIALMHSELSEVLEGLRHGNPPSDKIGYLGYTQAEEELADVIIRIMDYSAHKRFNLGKAIIAKMEYNNGRAYKHGGKVF